MRPQENAAERDGDSSTPLTSAVLGSLLLNSLYNADGQQRAGTIYLLQSLAPRDRPGLESALEELSDRPINTNSMLAGLALGPLLSVVQDPTTSKEEAREQAVRTASTLNPAVGALGDRLRFGALEPSASGGFLAAALVCPPVALPWYLLGLGIQIHWSRRAWRIGLLRQGNVLQWLGERVLDRWIGSFQRVARVLLAAVLAFVAVGIALRGRTDLVAFGILFAAGLFLGRRGRVSPFALAWIGVGTALLLGLIGQEG